MQGIRLAGISNSLKTVSYTRFRDKLDARFPHPKAPSEPQSIGKLVTASAIPGGAKFQFESCTLITRFLAPDFVFMAWDKAEMTPSYAVIKTDWPILKLALERTSDGWELKSDVLKLSVSDDGLLQFYDSANRLLRSEEAPLKYGNAWVHRATLPTEACIYGLGERSSELNLRPGKYRCWNKDAGSYSPGTDPMYIPMPVYYCLQESGGYLAFYDNTYEATFTLDDHAAARFEGGPLRYYLAFGSPPPAIQRFTELTGRAPLPPRWSLGYQQSRWGYNTEAEMRRVFKGYKEHRLPLSVLYLDIDYLVGCRVFTPDKTRYPALAEFAAELENSGIHLASISDAGVKLDPGWDIYSDGLEKDVYCKDPDGKILTGVVWPGWTVFPDFTDPRVREWWGSLHTRLFENGISGLWHDMNEPTLFTASGDMTMPLCTRHNLDGAGGDHRQAHNVFGLLMNRAGYEACRRYRPNRRPFILARSGWVGMQRYCWTWTGDIETSWAALRMSVAQILGMALCGMPYGGSDTGGFSGHPSTELYLRWFQLDSFMPVFRTHCAFYLPKRDPWEFGPEALGIMRAQLELRYKLMPYWYTLAWTASRTGAPLVRPIFWDESQNTALWEVYDEFLAGDAFLVAPVVKEGARRRTAILPKGSWYDFWNDKAIAGGAQEVELEAPLDRLPLLVRAGSVVPMVEDGILTLHVYNTVRGGSCGGVLYSDEGDGYGEHRVDTFRLQETGAAGYDLLWTSEGDYRWPYKETKIQAHGFGTAEVRLKKM